MRFTNKKLTAVIITLFSFSLLSGCTDWHAEYNKLLTANQNLKGRYQTSQEENEALKNQINQYDQTIKQMQDQMKVTQKTPAQVTGFEGFPVALNAAEGTITVTLPNSVLFDSGQAGLKKASSKELDSIYSVLKQKYSGKQVDVVGHTDSDPIQKSDWKDNWELSAERALTVTRYLVSHGMSEKQVRAVACGQSRPVAQNNSAENKAKNRRVEIVVHMR